MSKKCGCNLIKCGHTNLYILLILLGALFGTAKEIITYKSKMGQSLENEPEHQHPIITTINYAFGLCLSFIFFVIYKKCNKSNKNTNLALISTMPTKIIPSKEISKKEKFFWILLGAFLDFIANIIYSYNWILSEDVYITYCPTNILLMSLFSYWLLKTKLYKHHYLSIIVIVILGICYNFISGDFDLENLKNNYIGYIVYLFTESIFSILYVLYKFFMIKKSIKSYGILFFQGLIELLFGMITLAITTKYFPNVDSLETYKDQLDGSEILSFFSLIFINFVKYLTIFIIIDKFTPFHIFLQDILMGIIYTLFEWPFGDVIYKIAIYWIFIIICTFITLVYIEIIQLNFRGLSTMTKENIEERARLDSILYDEKNKDGNSDNYSDCDGRKISCEGYDYELQEFNNDNNKILPSNY